VTFPDRGPWPHKTVIAESELVRVVVTGSQPRVARRTERAAQLRRLAEIASTFVQAADMSHWPQPEDFTTAKDFVQGLNVIKRLNGKSFKVLEQLTKAMNMRVSDTALCKMLDLGNPRLPRHTGHIDAFLCAVGGGEVLPQWHEAWVRLTSAGTAPAGPRSETLAQPEAEAVQVPAMSTEPVTARDAADAKLAELAALDEPAPSHYRQCLEWLDTRVPVSRSAVLGALFMTLSLGMLVGYYILHT